MTADRATSSARRLPGAMTGRGGAPAAGNPATPAGEHRTRRAGRLALGAAAMAVAAGPAWADMLCIPRDAMVATLRADHGEAPVAIGLDNSGVMVEVFAAPAGTWTIVVTRTDGTSCLLAAGEDWEQAPAAVKENGT